MHLSKVFTYYFPTQLLAPYENGCTAARLSSFDGDVEPAAVALKANVQGESLRRRGSRIRCARRQAVSRRRSSIVFVGPCGMSRTFTEQSLSRPQSVP